MTDLGRCKCVRRVCGRGVRGLGAAPISPAALVNLPDAEQRRILAAMPADNVVALYRYMRMRGLNGLAGDDEQLEGLFSNLFKNIKNALRPMAVAAAGAAAGAIPVVGPAIRSLLPGQLPVAAGQVATMLPPMQPAAQPARQDNTLMLVGFGALALLALMR
ncbi:MAG: hypothetical protein DYG93_11200 [Leptolyngbya sp. PLA2]|nr:hypothetical protein [Leptolyngbya sp.]MCE7972210.1 hypothetical protein [Leptolyngbya sp. PL-A2]MCQ3941212.1 hypothetical protein [cyanobacterium CYA1]MDL1905497.1 hypothetical protein [Synechococcales cyanobacterium CNB]